MARGVEDALSCIGFALLSSATLAAAIKAYIESRKCKITVTISRTGKKLEYEGSNFSEDANTIEAMIDKLIEESGGNSLSLHAISYETLEETKGISTTLKEPLEKQSSNKNSLDSKDE